MALLDVCRDSVVAFLEPANLIAVDDVTCWCVFAVALSKGGADVCNVVGKTSIEVPTMGRSTRKYAAAIKISIALIC